MTTDPPPSSSQPMAPPVPPGTLTAPATGPEILDFLEALGRWADALGDALDEVDAAAQLAPRPDAYTAEITLAMSMRQSIDARYHARRTYDSGRVGPNELAELAQLIGGGCPTRSARRPRSRSPRRARSRPHS